jgi:transcriptional regulator with PAS, ATPase and Fis domain
MALLVKTFIHDLRSAGGKRISGVSPAVMDLFMSYEWPGNVRQLKSALEYAFAVAGPGVIDTQHLPAEFQASNAMGPGGSQTVETSWANGPPGEKKALLDALRRSGGNQSRAAKILGVHRMTVFNRMRKYGIHLKKM